MRKRKKSLGEGTRQPRLLKTTGPRIRRYIGLLLSVISWYIQGHREEVIVAEVTVEVTVAKVTVAKVTVAKVTVELTGQTRLI